MCKVVDGVFVKEFTFFFWEIVSRGRIFWKRSFSGKLELVDFVVLFEVVRFGFMVGLS